MDNTVVLTYFLKMGVAKDLQMAFLSKQIWELLVMKKVIVTVDYLPSGLNKGADIESCHKTDSSEWTLALSVLQRIFVKMGKP